MRRHSSASSRTSIRSSRAGTSTRSRYEIVRRLERRPLPVPLRATDPVARQRFAVTAEAGRVTRKPVFERVVFAPVEADAYALERGAETLRSVGDEIAAGPTLRSLPNDLHLHQ